MRYLTGRPAKDIAAAIVFCGVLCLLIWSALWAYRKFGHPSPQIDLEKYPVRGIDISRHNGNVDFRKVKDSGIDFVFIKASEGITHRDSLFKKNHELAREAGLKTGAYHFFRFDSDGPAQAINFLESVDSLPLELGYVIDVEKDGNPDGIPAATIKDRLLSMVEYMHLMGHRVTIYTNLEGYSSYVAPEFPGITLWICSFRDNPINADWTFWQYDHHGKVEGIAGEVDLNVFCGSREDWQRYLDGAVWPYSDN